MVRLNLYGRGRTLRIAVTITCQMAFVFFGYDQGVFSGIVTNPDWLQQFGNPKSSLEGIIVSIYNLGMFAGCILNFLVSEKIGRRRSMWLAMALVIVGATLQCSAFSLPHLMIAPFITGIGTGIDTSTTPVYQSELCDAKVRGRLVSSEPLFVGVGIVVAYWFDYGMSFVPGSISWRLPIGCQMIFAFAVIILVLGLPESPRWLYKRGRNDEALQVLCDIYNADAKHSKVEQETNAILEVLEAERGAGEYRWSQLFKPDRIQTGQRVGLAYGMQFMNQMGGINLVVYYVTSVLQNNVGLTRNLSLILGGCINTMFVIGSLVPSFFLDRLGRRRPMMFGSLGLAVSMMMIAILLSFTGKSVGKQTASASITFFFTYMLIFGSSVNCIPWVYVPEILPLHVRSKGAAVGTSANALWNFFVVMITPVITTALPWQWPLIFMALNLLFIPLVYFCYPETANLTLEEMDLLFIGGEHKEPRTKLQFAQSEAVVRSLNRNGVWRSEKRAILSCHVQAGYTDIKEDFSNMDDGEKY